MFQCLLSDNNLFLNMLQIMLPTPHQHACMRTIAASRIRIPSLSLRIMILPRCGRSAGCATAASNRPVALGNRGPEVRGFRLGVPLHRMPRG